MVALRLWTILCSICVLSLCNSTEYIYNGGFDLPAISANTDTNTAAGWVGVVFYHRNMVGSTVNLW